MKIGTYTKDSVKIVDSGKLYLVHPDTNQLQEVTFFVAKNDEMYYYHVQLPLCLDLYNQEQD